jgi:hypothetical protein
VYELKLGWSHDKIAAEMEISYGTVQKRIDAHLALRVHPLADEVRSVMVDPLDLCIEKSPTRSLPTAWPATSRCW